MNIGSIESTWKRRFMIVVSFPFVVVGDMWRQAKFTFGMAKWAWAKREPVVHMETIDTEELGI